MDINTATGPTAGSADAASGKAPELVRQVAEQGREAVAELGGVAQDAKDRGISLVGEIKDKAVSAAESAKDQFAGRLDHLSDAVHQTTEALQGKDDGLAKLVERGAAELGQLASTLRSNDLQGVLGKLGELARNQPVVFVGAAIAAGFATVRLGTAVAAGVTQADMPTIPEAGRGTQ